MSTRDRALRTQDSLDLMTMTCEEYGIVVRCQDAALDALGPDRYHVDDDRWMEPLVETLIVVAEPVDDGALRLHRRLWQANAGEMVAWFVNHCQEMSR